MGLRTRIADQGIINGRQRQTIWMRRCDGRGKNTSEVINLEEIIGIALQTLLGGVLLSDLTIGNRLQSG